MKKFLSLIFSILLLATFVKAQTAEVTIQLNEQFFDALLDAVFKGSSLPEFPLALEGSKSAGESSKFKVQSSKSEIQASDSRFQISDFRFQSFFKDQKPKTEDRYSSFFNTENTITNPSCSETIRLQREIEGVRTAVRFRDGRIFAPIAFSGSYNPPLVGCVAFSGWAETNIELEFNRERQTLVGRAVATNVQISGTRGIGSAFVTKLVQSSIDGRINPIQILPLEKVSFVVPIQNAGTLKMKAIGMRHEIVSGALNVRIAYEFQKTN